MTDRTHFVNAHILPIIIGFAIFYSSTGRCDTAQPAGSVSPLIVLVTMQDCCTDEAWPEAEMELRKEFSVLHLSVKEVSGQAQDETERRLELNNLAARHGAAAAVRVVKTMGENRASVDIWVNDRITNKLTYRNVPIDNIESDEAPVVAAIRIVELLQASLMELTMNRVIKSPEAPKETPSTLPVPEKKEDKSERHKLRLGIGAAIIGSPGGVGAMGALELHLGWLPLKWLSFDIESHVTLVGKEITHDNSRSTFDLVSVRLWSSIHFKSFSILHPFVGLGLGFSYFWVDGSSENGIPTKREGGINGGVWGRLGLSFKLSDSIWLPVSATIGTLFSNVNVDFGQETVATFGVPVFEGSLALEIHFL